MAQQDVRWVQRFEHFVKGLAQLEDAEQLARARDLTNLERQGFIKGFEFTFEQAWLTLKDFLESRGVQGLYGAKDAIQGAFRSGLVANGEVWMDMIQSRNLTSHTYDETTSARILTVIRTDYIGEFEALKTTLAEIAARPTAGDAP
jgi:nucleotidyltransferase substrate binding protein (TIGR01987 family)